MINGNSQQFVNEFLLEHYCSVHTAYLPTSSRHMWPDTWPSVTMLALTGLMTSVGLFSTSDVITFDQNWYPLYSSSTEV